MTYAADRPWRVNSAPVGKETLMPKYTPELQKTIIDNNLTDMYQQIAESLCDENNVIDRDTGLLIRSTLGPIMFEDFVKYISPVISVEREDK
jgi:hypothetical protein